MKNNNNINIIAGENRVYENDKFIAQWEGGYDYLMYDSYSSLTIRDKQNKGVVTFNIGLGEHDSYMCTIAEVEKQLSLLRGISIERKKIDTYCEELDEHFIVPVRKTFSGDYETDISDCDIVIYDEDSYEEIWDKLLKNNFSIFEMIDELIPMMDKKEKEEIKKQMERLIETIDKPEPSTTLSENDLKRVLRWKSVIELVSSDDYPPFSIPDNISALMVRKIIPPMQNINSVRDIIAELEKVLLHHKMTDKADAIIKILESEFLLMNDEEEVEFLTKKANKSFDEAMEAGKGKLGKHWEVFEFMINEFDPLYSYVSDYIDNTHIANYYKFVIEGDVYKIIRRGSLV